MSNKIKLVVRKEIRDFKDDKLNRQAYGEDLLRLVTQSEGVQVIALDGEWGEGKTTFVKMWQGLLDGEDSPVPNMYINAFENDYHDNAFITLASEIIDYAKNNIKDEKYLKTLTDKVVKVGGQLLPLAVNVAIKAATAGAIDGADIKDFSKVTADVIEEKLTAHTNNKEEVEGFKKELSNLPSKLKKSKVSTVQPLVIIIDELDRCKPTFALELIERGKHLFAVENIIFVLVMNKPQLEKSVQVVYGDIDVHTYLQKFIDLALRLPKRKNQQDPNLDDLNCYTYYLIQEHGLNNYLYQIAEEVHRLANHLDLSLRQLEKVFVNIALLYSTSSESKDGCISLLIAVLAIIKTTNPKLFDSLLNNQATYKDVSAALSFPTCKEATSYEEVLQSALLDEQAYKDLDANSKIKGYADYFSPFGRNRTGIITSLAKKMSLFQV